MKKKNSIKRAQSQAGLSFAERKNFRPMAKILTLLVLLMTAVTGAWAGTQATGYFDHCTAHHGSIFVDGWAYDPDQSSVSIQVHAYIWSGTSASGSHMPVVVIDTDVQRSDVNSAKGITGIHGFERYITVPAGTYTVEIYAIDKNGDGNPKLPVAVPGDPTYITVTVTGDPYNITYDANGGSGAPAAQQKGENVQLTLSSTVPTRTGYTFAGWNTASDGSGTAYAAGATYTANAALTLYAQWALDFAGQGTQELPYLITSIEDWNNLAEDVSSGKSYSGKYFQLTDNISVTNMVGGGGGSYVFSGIFDGDGHTITFNSANATEQYIAPFRFISDATIKNLKVAGSVSSSDRFAGGIVAYAKGTSTVTGCMNSTSITINGNISNASNGGIVGMVGASGKLTITGCVFNGEMKNNTSTSSSMNWCGILGLCNSSCTATISNCLFAPVAVVVNGDTKGNTIYRSTGVTTADNCYYTYSMSSSDQGNKVYTITGGEKVSVAFAGTPLSDATVGVIAYEKGIKCGDVLYASKDDAVSLNLNLSPGYDLISYAASTGSLNGSANPYTLTMPAANVTITATYTEKILYDVTANLANGAYWATFYSNVGNYQAPVGTQVFAVTLTGTAIEMTEIEDRIVKSGEGVVLKKTTTGSFTMTKTATTPAGDFSGNDLTGTMTSITNPGNAYVLNGKNGAGFYKLSDGGTIGANKAYLTYSGAGAREFFLFDEATGIEMPTVEDVNADALVYDLQGRRVVNPTKGLYIVNGKKVFINK